ncbi:hypothetical protein E4U39_004675 [Claviceps sp. Clav50 group G5]|nr:hypothetical protein E4U39_004675 [Claviceps sp. Clav50 group G5]
MPEVEAVIDARGKLDPLSSNKLEIGAELEVEIALKTSTEADATLELEVKAGLEMRIRLEAAPGNEVGVVCEPRAGVDSEADVDGNFAVLMLPVLILDRPDKVNTTPDNAGPGSMVNASDDPDKVDSVTGSVKVVGREDARPDETGADEMRLELLAKPGAIDAARLDEDDGIISDDTCEAGIDDVGFEGVNPDEIEKAAPCVAGDDNVGVKEAGVSDESEPNNPELVAPDELELAVVDPDKLKPDDTGKRELDDARLVEAVKDEPTGVDSDDLSPDEVGLNRLETEGVGSFEPEAADLKPAIGSGISGVDDTSPFDVSPYDGLPDDAGRNEIVVKPKGVPDDEGPESEGLDSGCVSDAIDSLDDNDDDRLGEKETTSEDAIVSTVADEPREVRSDEPRRTLVMKPEDVNAGHEGLEEDGEEKEEPETAEEGATSEPDEISVELELKVDDASWVVDPTCDDVPNDSVVDTRNETGWYVVAAESDDKDTELDGPGLHVDIVERPGCVLAADPYDPGADEADATDSEGVSEYTGPGELDATRLGGFTPDDAGSDDGGTGDTEVDETVLGISEPEEDACTDSDVGDVELEERASVDCELDGNERISDVGPDEAGADEANVDDVSSAVGIDDAVSNGVETDEAALDTDRLDESGFGSFDIRPDDEGMGD